MNNQFIIFPIFFLDRYCWFLYRIINNSKYFTVTWCKDLHLQSLFTVNEKNIFIFKLLAICICCLESRESSDDDQTDWKPKTDNHCVKIKKTLFDCFDEYISSHDEDSHSIHIVGGCKQSK